MDIKSMGNQDTRTYEEIYNSLFKEIVENPDGTLNKDQVMRELADYTVMLKEVPKVYCHITGNRVSYPTTLASAVIAIADEVEQERWHDWLQDEREQWECNKCGNLHLTK